MPDLVVTDLTFAVTNEDSVTSNGSGPASPGSARAKRQSAGTRQLSTFHGTITIPSSAATYATGGIPISGVTNSATGEIVAGNALANPGLGCPNEIVELTVEATAETAGFVTAFVRGVPGTSPHKLKLFVDNAVAAAAPLAEVANGTAANSATVFPGAPTVFNVTVVGW